MTQDALNTTLSGKTGTGNVLSDDSPVLTGNVDCTGASPLTIPSSANPIFTNTGEISLDSGITDYNTQLTHYDGTDNIVNVSMLTSDLNSTDGYGISYNATNDKFEMIPVTGVASGEIVQLLEINPVVLAATNSSVYTYASFSGSITPKNAANIITVQMYGQGEVQGIGVPDTSRSGSFRIYRTTGTPAALAVHNIGRVMSTTSSNDDSSYSAVVLYAQETAGDTNLHTYDIEFLTFSSNNFVLFESQMMVIMEVTP